MKTAEELKKRAERIIPDTQYKGIKHIRYSFDERELQEYAEEFHKSKMAKITDEDIEKWDKEQAFSFNSIKNSTTAIQEAIIICYHAGLRLGAKAMRNGYIKHT